MKAIPVKNIANKRAFVNLKMSIKEAKAIANHPAAKFPQIPTNILNQIFLSFLLIDILIIFAKSN